ncbi:MAG: hypothetical protein AAF684_01685 [Pseudomonadota bacterium]
MSHPPLSIRSRSSVAAAPLCALLAACAAEPGGDLPPLEEADQPSLAVERVQPTAPTEDGPGVRNPDDPFLIAVIDAEQRVVELFAGGVAERSPGLPECAAALQRAQSARIVISEAPDACDGVDLRLRGPGAENVTPPEPPPAREIPGFERPEDDTDPSLLDRMLSIFG